MNTLEELKVELQQFAQERDWDQFHSPKNLAMALAGEAGEAGELLEVFQWLTEEQSKNLTTNQMAAVADELADIQIYLIRLADKLNLDLTKEAKRKIASNAVKYPINKAKGNPKKYTDL
ncbi:nucleotide pyrophosphohydrolase [Zooshikella sp. RANM57]|uniref:nucleotide pyrophosphohydrolase n=1 Tax=Zooshikella sp. RANM57 TaxID=3425863 RepID=UPI003D6DB01F